jgi:hypothetical protein
MEDDQDEHDVELIEAYLDARDRALMVHEAGHAVVARALGADVLFVEIDLATGDGGSRSSTFDDDQIKNLAVCVAGCRAEHAFDARASRKTKKGDFRMMRQLLSCLPETDRRVARAEGYRLADAILKEKQTDVEDVVAELMARRWKDGTAMVRIEGDELIVLLDR